MGLLFSGAWGSLLGYSGRLLAGADGWLAHCSGRSYAILRSGSRALSCALLRGVGPSCCPTSRRGTRAPPPLLVPGERLGAGPAGAEECQSGLSTRVASGERPAAALALPAKRAGQPPEVHDRRAQDGALDKPKERHRFGHPRRRRAYQDCLGSLPTAWATAAARRGTRAAARTAARTARTASTSRPATPCRCAVGGGPTTPASRGSHPHRNPSASRRRSRARSASSTSS